ncbi:histone-lysine N-methyltransferase SMYD3 isoform X2 [Bos indicus]|uniref:Histone-lysine N-methyltransferase SMYD3 n=2 Tax=Bos TaxID=9903 RepID=Q0P5C5_BOVIN|nr:histone-lysine N-methyltransferase SMYD3 [Bos taurus]XP_005893450.1 PREDICTED: histone-lysine N-methyltransferase SMYD3 isoform X2 [Bos mutus]XP_027420471.1 histone-lysine N-methyltransferase SMYD3 isoform X2 [Bos indicus x Bos taurus]AAI20242.1 SET and MYND domain containing 3 [Bos taurus]DAA21403.1 TPA: SET and MYND domain containing 3 [Bos taurus]
MEPSKVEKFSTTDKGNGLRALAPLRPGELLFRSDPLAYTVSKGSRGVVCDRCLLGKEKLMRCSQCRIAKYCSAKCQKKAWQDHKRECKCLKSCKPRYPPDSVRLLGRVVFKLMQETPSESEKLYSFYDLESNINKLTEDKKEGLRQLALTFQHFMREEIQDASQLPPSFDIFEAFAKVICNSFTICNAEMQEVGVGLYPSMSLLNHSCDPNCSIVFNGPHLLLRAVRDVEAGEEDADMLTGDEQVWKEVQESLKKIEDLKAHWKWEQVLAMCQSIISSNAERLPDINIYQLKVLDCAMDACLNLGLLEEALFYGIRTMEPYRIFYPGNHPVRGVQIMKVGKLQLHQGMFPQAMKNLRLAFDIMRVTHGREHSLIEDLILLLEECDANIRAP